MAREAVARTKPAAGLVTGFHPFGPWKENTALWAARAAASASFGRVASLELPVEYDRAAAILLATIAATRPRLVVSLGMAGTRNEVSLETTAVNEDNADLADNAGANRRGDAIDPSGPPTLSTEFPREELRDALRSAGFEANLSADAGRFVCNNLFYRAASALAEGMSPDTRFAFVHIPGPATWDLREAERFGEVLGQWLAARLAAEEEAR